MGGCAWIWPITFCKFTVWKETSPNVCPKCKAKYFSKDETEKCYDAHVEKEKAEAEAAAKAAAAAKTKKT